MTTPPLPSTHDGPGRGAPGEVVHLSSPADLLAAVPHLFGFVPHDSLVLLGLRPPRGRVEVSARVDLPAPEHEREAVRALLPVLSRARVREVLLVVYAPDAVPTGVPRRASDTDATGLPAPLPHVGLVDRVGAALARRGVVLRDAVCVQAGRFRSYLCADESCCPAEGLEVPAPEHSLLAPHTVVAGRVLWPDREALSRSVGPADPAALAAVREAVDATVDEIVARLADGGSVRSIREETLQLWDEQLATVADPPPGTGTGAPVTATVVARLLVGLADVVTRDVVLARSVHRDPVHALALLGQLVRQAVHPYVAAAAVLLGWHAYLAGHGALANVAVERALAADPDHSLGRLLDDALCRGLPPSQLRRIALASAREAERKLRRGSPGGQARTAAG